VTRASVVAPPPVAAATALVVGAILILAVATGHARESRAAATRADVSTLLKSGRAQAAVGQLTVLIGHDEDRLPARLRELLSMRAEAYRMLGSNSLALADLQQALKLSVDAAVHLPRLHGAIASILVQSGQLDPALRKLDLTLALARQHDDKVTEARALNDIGAALSAWDSRHHRAIGVNSSLWPISAQDAFERSAALADALRLHQLSATTRLNLARAQIAAGEAKAATNTLREAADIARSGTNAYAKLQHLVAYARALGELESIGGGEYKRDKFEALHEALDLATTLNSQRMRSLALGYLAEVYENDGRIAESIRLTDQALFTAIEIHALDLSYSWLGQLARLREASGDEPGALEAYRGAVAALRASRVDLVATLPGPAGRFNRTVRPIYQGLADLLLRRSGRATDESHRQAMLAEARDTMELFKSAELEDYFQDDCVAALQAKRRPIDALLKRAAAIYPIVLKDRLELLVSLPGKLVRRVSAASAAQVVYEATRFRQSVEQPNRRYRAPARKLYNWLIRPIEAELEGIDTLVFIPGAPLRAIPFAALYDGREHLVERFAVATAPGLSLLDPGPLERDAVDLLVAGLSVPVQGYDALPYVNRELTELHALLGGTILKDEQFVDANVTAALSSRPYSIVHIASHAEFGPTAESSFLLTYDGKLTMNGLERLIKLSEFRDNPIELLTLSACETAAGDERAALGLAGIAIKAGARSTLASLWLVNDEATAVLIGAFHKALREHGVSKAAALRAAQLGLLKQRRFRYPRSWAPFILIGSWQ
jgi:CHAT domain-containing protein